MYISSRMFKCATAMTDFALLFGHWFKSWPRGRLSE